MDIGKINNVYKDYLVYGRKALWATAMPLVVPAFGIGVWVGGGVIQVIVQELDEREEGSYRVNLLGDSLQKPIVKLPFKS